MRHSEIGSGLDGRSERNFGDELRGKFLIELFGHLERRRAVAGHLRGGQHEVDIVHVIAEFIHRMRRPLGEFGFVSFDGGDIHVERFFEAADAVIGVRGHVDEVSEPRRQGGKSVGVAGRPIRIVRVLRCMDVEVDRWNIVRVAREHGFEQ